MIDKKTRMLLKNEIKSLCKPNVIKLAKEVGLDKFEEELLIGLYEGRTIVDMCMTYHISKPTYNRYMQIIFTKIYDYKNTLH